MVYSGELLRYPGPYGFLLNRQHIILVNDEQLRTLTDPDAKVDLSLTYDKRVESLREICERAQAAGQRTLIFAFDGFFSQYREGGLKEPRQLTPDRDAYIEHIGVISRFAQGYGLGLELSLLSPLEIGPGYHEATGESGRWMHVRKGLRDPETGAYSVSLWRQQRWGNNKGVVEVKDDGVRVFAFRERPIGGTPYRVVRPEDIVDISDTASVEVFEGLQNNSGDYGAVRVRVHGSGGAEGLDRVCVVQLYRTPEMDYFSDSALPYLTELGDRYSAAGVLLNGLYSDEMHIQQDWNYFGHHDHGQFALRYVSPGFEKRFAQRYGEAYQDFAKYMIYFVNGQEDTVNNLTATMDVMHVFGSSPQDIRRTALMRSNYYRMLQNGVVDLFAAAKEHVEGLMGHRLEARAHATWAESPTIDHWYVERQNRPQQQYEYTPNFVWSCTVHQAASACHDYFKWNDFLTGGGNDHPEGGWLDRNYYALALACSTGILNPIPYAYCAHWGMPGAISHLRNALVNTFGAFSSAHFSMVQDMEHRDVEMLMLYPLDLVSVNDRFGSWMTQYGYTNYVTQEKLLEMGRVEDGAILLGGRRFTTLAALFEPFPEEALLAMMHDLAEQGGQVIWSGPPPLINRAGDSILEKWETLTGTTYTPTEEDGLLLPGRNIRFSGTLASVPDMPILTSFLVDRVYPVTAAADTEVVAQVEEHTVGTLRSLGAGTVTTLGFRPRDDQSKSLGYEMRHWFEIAVALGVYPPTGVFPGVNDNTEYLSRTTDYLCCRFPNKTVAVAPHLHALKEDWPGGFARKQEEDEALIKTLDLPDGRIHLEDFKVNGKKVSYDGNHALSFRVNDEGALIAFTGCHSQSITVDGITTTFADQAMPLIAWAPVREDRTIPGGAVLSLFYHGSGTLRIPVPELGTATQVEVCAQGAHPGSRGAVLDARLEAGILILDAVPAYAGRWIYVMASAS
ncbi:MAG: hypothetical protein GX117_07265 [Candidatus Hydrogenedentes bacterium]|nr:hypothetical protein [Candidatus Hydrogenedentota bacterium]